MKILNRIVKKSILATAEVMYPNNSMGAPDFNSTDLVNRTYDWVMHMPPQEKPMLLALFLFIEKILPLYMISPGSFSKKTMQRRTTLLQKLGKSRFFYLRFIMESLKSILQMLYMSHEKSLNFYGIYKNIAYPDDVYPITIKEEVHNNV